MRVRSVRLTPTLRVRHTRVEGDDEVEAANEASPHQGEGQAIFISWGGVIP